MTWLSDVVYKLNRTGPRTDPCGTPNGRCCGQDSVPDMLILWSKSEKYGLNHRRAGPEIPKCRRWCYKRIKLSIVSKAAERSSKVSVVTLPLSMLSTISLCILRRAVSVEWNRLYADCRSFDK